ncbi:hypothetical protein AG1IA_01003 [Rhizoctonia solani AG-1 IA]|uniref:Uncharacterized protein n=1 Tax=Thanatephorus cucumeris (strain AG1-IA) TaxID=983506 RepID=L8X3T0_THACA|nr:hypothetical protein AG1IA_01003 [Rhizoctonia solani AG-1 IA]
MPSRYFVPRAACPRSARRISPDICVTERFSVRPRLAYPGNHLSASWNVGEIANCVQCHKCAPV